MPVRPDLREEIIARVNRKYEGSIRKGDDYEKPRRIPTGSLELDVAMGVTDNNGVLEAGVPMGRWSRFYGGYHCVAPGSLVLRADFQWVPIETLEAGDRIVGFDENAPGGRGKQRRFVESTVIDNPRKHLPSKRIVVDKDEEVVASDEHLWLVSEARSDGAGGARTIWKRTDALEVGDRILWFGKPWSELVESQQRESAAYLGGLFDGEGSVYRGRVHLYQNPGAVLEKAETALADLGFSALKYDNKECKRLSIEATVAGTMRFFSHIPTTRLSDGAGNWWQDREILPKGRYREHESGYAVVKAVEDVGVQEVYAIGTSSQTLIVNGMFSHNSTKTLSALSVIAQAQEMGLSCAYYNVEKQYDPVFAKEKLGVDIEALTIVEGSTVEQIGEEIESLFGVIHVHVIDSCSIAVSEDELNADVRDWRPGIGARAWGKVYRRLNERFDHVDNTVIQIDQITIDFKTGGENAKGGKVFDHQSSMTCYFKKGQWLFRNEQGCLDEKAKQEKGASGMIEPSGYEVKCRIEKSRVGRPFRTATLRLDLDTMQFDRTFEYLKMAKHYKVVEQRGPYYYLHEEGEVKERFQGEKALRAYIAENEDIREKIRETALVAGIR